MADDLERLQRYLQWRDRTNEAARRAVRRRRLRGVVVAAAVAVVAVATLSWLLFGMRDARLVAREDAPAGSRVRAMDLADASPGAASDAKAAPRATPPASPEALVSTAPQVLERAPVARKPSPNASRRTAGAAARPPARAVRPQATPMARVEPAPDERHDSAPPVEAAVPSTAPPPVVENPSVAQTPPVTQPPVTVAPATITSIETKSPCDDVTASQSPDARTRGQRVSDCVGGWLKGQSRQFSDGAKREVDDFRTGLDHVGRGLQWLGSKLRRPG